MSGRSDIVTRNLNDTAVYWGGATSDGIGGRTFDDPAEVSVRWEDVNEIFIDPFGRETVSHARLFSAVAMTVGGYVVESTLAELSSAEEGDPQIVTNAREIRRVDRVKNLRGDLTLYKVWL